MTDAIPAVSLCSHCGRPRNRCRTAENPFLSCCGMCAANDGDTHWPGRPLVAPYSHPDPHRDDPKDAGA